MLILTSYFVNISPNKHKKGFLMEETQEYSNKMIEAFVAKPEKTFWYQNAFSLFNVNGVDAMKWKWSWWAFFGGFLFLLYRKQYIPALVVLGASIFLGWIPFVGLIIAILVGGYSTYFVYKGYKSKLTEVERSIPVEEEAKRVQTMQAIGGYHAWVVWIYVAFVGLIGFGIVAAVAIPALVGAQ